MQVIHNLEELQRQQAEQAAQVAQLPGQVRRGLSSWPLPDGHTRCPSSCVLSRVRALSQASWLLQIMCAVLIP